jgi:hypothetical protein
VIKLAEKAGIVFGTSSTDITVQNLEKFLALARARGEGK